MFSQIEGLSVDEGVSFVDYVSRMKEGQEAIYYITADSYAAARNSPHLEIFRKKGVEVLLMTDRVDEWMLSFLTEFEGKELVSVAKGGLDLGGPGTERGDLDGAIECLFFPSAYMTVGPMLQQDTVAVVRGKVNRRDDTVSIYAQELTLPDLSDGPRGPVVVSMPVCHTAADGAGT